MNKTNYQSLYRKYRPSHLDEVVGQKHILEVLNSSLKKDMISHAYLFCGPRGTGKTSIAKLFAQSINCETQGVVACGTCSNCIEGRAGTHPDIVEIDAASNNGVEEIRSLIDRIKYTPILGKYKVYIIDEVHMLSAGAFNAFLKTLEEPPAHAVFVLATTEIHKVIPTIVSRCQRFDFSNLSNPSIEARLDYILTQESVEAEAGVNQLIASLSNGALRNALTILEQAMIVANPVITLNQVHELNGVVSPRQKYSLIQAILGDDMTRLNNEISRLLDMAVDVQRLVMDLVYTIKDTVVYQYTNTSEHAPYSEQSLVEFIAPRVATNTLLEMIETLLEYVERMKFSHNQDAYLQISLIKLFNLKNEGVVLNSPVITEVKNTVELITDFSKKKPVAEVNNPSDTVVSESKDNNHPVPLASENQLVSTDDMSYEGEIMDVDEPVHSIETPVENEEIAHIERHYVDDPLSNGSIQTDNLTSFEEKMSENHLDMVDLTEDSTPEDSIYMEEMIQYEEESISEYNVDIPIDSIQNIDVEDTNDNSSLTPEKVESMTDSKLNLDVATENQEVASMSNKGQDNPSVIDVELIVKYMVSANKDLRMIDEVGFKEISQYINDFEWAKCARLIENGTLALSGEHFIMITLDDELQAKEVMEPTHNAELIKFSSIIFNREKHIYATTKELFSKAVLRFRELHQSNNLPEPLTLQEIQREVTQQQEETHDLKLGKVMELFGNKVSIIE